MHTETRSSATAEKQRVSCACVYLDWLTDHAMHRISQMLYYFLTFKRSDSRRAGRKLIMTWNSRSRSFKVIHFAISSHQPTKGSISSYNIACRIWSFRRRKPPKSPKIAFVDNSQCRLMPPPRGIPANIRMNLIFPETTVICLHFSWFLPLCSGLQKTHLFCNRVLAENGFWRQIAMHSGSFEVIHFAISYRPTRDSISPYNIVGLISEDSEEVATRIAKNCGSRVEDYAA